MENKRGYTTATLIGVIFIALFVLVILGVVIWALSGMDSAFSQIDIDFGDNNSFNTTYEETLKPGLTAATTTVPKLMSTGILLGMIVLMLLVAYKTERVSRLWIVLDIFIIIAAEIGSVFVVSSFRSFINSSPEMLTIFSTTLSVGSKYILNLPIIIPVLGALVMVITHMSMKRRDEEASF